MFPTKYPGGKSGTWCNSMGGGGVSTSSFTGRSNSASFSVDEELENPSNKIESVIGWTARTMPTCGFRGLFSFLRSRLCRGGGRREGDGGGKRFCRSGGRREEEGGRRRCRPDGGGGGGRLRRIGGR